MHSYMSVISVFDNVIFTGFEGFSNGLWRKFSAKRKRLIEAGNQDEEIVQPKVKVWKPKRPELPILSDYSGKFSEEYWRAWPSYKPATWAPESWIDAEALKKEAEAVNYPLQGRLLWAIEQLSHGAWTGVTGAGRLGSEGKNAKSAIKHGHLLSDSLAEWVRLELMAGPYSPDEIPWISIKISPLGIQVKPSGAGRILVDMSFPWKPKGEEVNISGSIPISPNDAICLKDFPSFMDGTPQVLKLLVGAGPGCHLTKAGETECL